MIARLGSDRRGATIVEFAIVAPVLILFIFGVMEGARALWIAQSLQETVSNSARCLVIGRSPCENIANTKTYAIARAAKSSLTVPAASVTAEKGVTCNGLSGQGKVAIAMPFNSVLSSVMPNLTSINVSACMPVPPAS